MPGRASPTPTSSTPGRSMSPGSLAPGTPMRWGCCTGGTAAGRAAPPRRPASSSSCRSGTATGAASWSGPTARWRELPAEWLPSPQRNSDGGDFVEWVDGRAHPQGWSNPGFDDGAWATATVIGPVGTAPFTGIYAQRTRIEGAPGVPRARPHPDERRGGGRLRGGLRGAPSRRVRQRGPAGGR